MREANRKRQYLLNAIGAFTTATALACLLAPRILAFLGLWSFSPNR